MQKIHITIFIQFPFFKSIINMSGYYRLVFLEQLCHLLLSQPYSLFIHSYFQPDGFIGLVQDKDAIC